MKNNDFESIWWEMEELEPLTPVTTCNETNEIPSTIQIPEKEGILKT